MLIFSGKNEIMLTANELQDAMVCMIKLVQKETFADELWSLNNKKSVPRTSRLLSLTPFLDKDGLIRVGGWG